MNLFAQAFEAIASSSGAYKCKTRHNLTGLEHVENESESRRKDRKCPRTNALWTNTKQSKSEMVTKIVAGSSIVFCHLPRWQSQTSESLARCHIRLLLVPSSGAARPSLTPIFQPPFCPK